MSSGHPSLPYPPSVTAEELDSLVQAAKDWSMANGLCVRPPLSVARPETDPAGVLATSAPVTLFPSAFPLSCFEQGQAVQQAYNELYAKVAQDETFIRQMVDEVAEGDDFIANLWGVHQRVKEEGYTHKLSLGLFRSDYMAHEEDSLPPQIKQVEFNTIASSFGGLVSKTTELHKFLAQTQYPLLSSSPAINPQNLPDNPTVPALAGGLAQAHKSYGPSRTGNPLCVLFLVQTNECNIFDQRHLEHHLQQQQQIPVFRLDFSRVLQHTRIAERSPSRELLYVLPSNPSKVFEVSTVYLRSGYGPADYADDDGTGPGAGWETRYHLERSAAIKCPTVLTQLAGAKKIQQLLSCPTVLDRFVSAAASSALVQATFATMYPLDSSSSAGIAARKLALDEKECLRFVLKPQREGGGNNTYRGAIPPFLRAMPEARWKSFVLMELITPPPARNLILRDGRVKEGGVIGELGVYGTCLWRTDSGEVLHNERAGYILRTKGDKSEEGGVAAGFGCMDSVFLV